MTLPRISIVTISFNQAQFLPFAVESVLGQEYPNLQYIVVDPGSQDASRDIIESYRDQVSVKVFEKDSGPADGLNKGFARADGEILGFLNADDVLLPKAFETVAQYFLQNPDIDVVSGHCQIIDASGNVLRTSYSDSFHPRKVIYRAACLMQPSTFFRRRAYARTDGFNIANRLDWDTELFVDLCAAGARFARINAVLSGCRIHSSTVTAQRRNGMILHKDFRQLLEQKYGRKWGWFDHPIRWGFMLLKYLRNPRSVRERLLRGPIAGRTE